MDDLTRINGIGKATADKLAAAGIDSFLALAHMQPDDPAIAEFGIREEWRTEAAQLAGAVPGTPLAANDAATPSTHAPRERTEGGGGGPAAPARPYNREAFADTYPHLAAAMEAWAAEHGVDAPPAGIRVAAKRAGFRRAGIAHATEPVSHPLDTLHPVQIEALLAEPMIEAVFVP